MNDFFDGLYLGISVAALLFSQVVSWALMKSARAAARKGGLQ